MQILLVLNKRELETTFNWYLKRMQEEQQNPFVESITINNIPKIDTRYTDPLMGPYENDWKSS